MVSVSNSDLRVIFWNAQSVGNKRVEIFDFLIREKIDIALISETWLKPNYSFFHCDFEVIRSDRTTGEHGGVAIVVRKNIQFKRLASLKTKVIENVGVSLMVNNKILHFYSVYFPGSSNRTVLEKFRQDIISLSNLSSSFIIAGDLNSKYKLWNKSDSNSAGSILFNEISNLPFILMYPDEPTHYPYQANSQPSCIDVILTNLLHNISELSVLSELSSDHLPVFFTVQGGPSISNNVRNVFNYKSADWIEFRKYLNVNTAALPQDLSSPNLIDDSVSKLTSLVHEACDKFIPKVIPKTHNLVLTPEIHDLIRVRNKVRKKWQKSRNPSDLSSLKSLNFRIRFSIKILRNKNWTNLLGGLKLTGSKKFWKVTKLIKNKHNKIPSLIQNGQTYASNSQKANILSEQFNKSHHLTSQFSSKHKSLVTSSIEKLNKIQKFQLNARDNISLSEVSLFIKQLKNSNSSGPDNISNRLIKKLPNQVLQYLVKLFNGCLTLGYFPHSWKVAKVIAIPKPNKSRSSPSNYRPISLLPCLSKVFEKCILSRLSAFIEDSQILPNEQFGFRKKHSTSHQALRMKNLIQEKLNNKKSTGMVFLDLEKAFDTIWHDGLLHKLIINSVPTYLIKIIQSFLRDRNFFVQVEEDISNRISIKAGVPQGAVLSPTLFNVFLFDIPSFFRCILSLFADDTAILTSSDKPGPIMKRLQSSLTKIQNYFLNWKIKVNPSKTQCIFFSRKRKNLPSQGLKFGDTNVNFSDNVKYLGIHFDKRLTFKSHIEDTCVKASKYIRVLYPLLNRNSRLSVANKVLLYKSVFRSILTYGAPVWCDCSKTNLDKLQRIQNKVLKLAHGLPFFFGTQSLHNLVNIEYLSDFCKRVDSKFRDGCLFSDNPLINQLVL
jgi:hypothetical protein